MWIKDRPIDDSNPPFVIAEIGINHNGSLDIAKEMVKAAWSAGAECVKHQTHIIDDEMSPDAKKVIPANASSSIYDIMERCALSEEDEIALKEYVEYLGMIFISTPFSRAAANRLYRMNVDAFKIGSGECNNIPLIKHVASFGKPMIVSTGMNTMDSIQETVNILEESGVEYALLHCTNVYPTPPRIVRLNAITTMKRAFPNAEIGLSDHTRNNNACLGAVALGANILERHFTDCKNKRIGEDIICSMDPNELTSLIQGSREIFEMRGSHKGPVREEKPCIDFAFATVVTTKEIKKGKPLTTDNTWVKRPGTGEIPAKDYEMVLGKKVNRTIKPNTHLSLKDIND